MISRRLSLPTVALVLSGCALLNGRCLYEIRGVQGAGQVDEAGAPLASAQVTLSEQRDQDPNKSFYWAITGPSLKGHVQSAVLKDAADSHVMLTLNLADASRPVISENEVSTRSNTDLNGFFDVLVAGRGRIELQTDQPAHPTIVIPITVTSRTDWTRPYCS